VKAPAAGFPHTYGIIERYIPAQVAPMPRGAPAALGYQFRSGQTGFMFRVALGSLLAVSAIVGPRQPFVARLDDLALLAPNGYRWPCSAMARDLRA